MHSLVLNGQIINLTELKKGDVRGHTPFEQDTLRFCSDWLSGKSTFTLHTSGSTGKPGQVTVSRQQMQLSARQTNRFFRITAADTVLVCLPTAFVAGIMMLVRAFEAGAAIVAVEPAGNPLARTEVQPDFLAVVPLQLEKMLADSATANRLARCRAVLVGGAPISPALEEQARLAGIHLYASFGMTETLTHFALRQVSPQKETAYTALEGVELGLDTRGCLTVKSPVTGHRTLITNDRVEWLPPNRFVWLGRHDHVINSGGIKLQPEVLEQKIARYFAELGITNRFIVTGLPDGRLGQKAVLVVEGQQLPPALEKPAWPAYLGRYERPKEIKALPRFAETPTGKIDRPGVTQALGR